jgi:DNA invertase Pin-like site-specific DNA recombinase
MKEPTTMSRRIGIYARVSKAERDDPTSIPVQLEDCRSRAAAESWEIVDEYADTGISAWSPRRKRPEFERLLVDIEAGRIDTVLVREQERLLRQMKDAVRVQDLADAGKLKLIAATMESDINFGRARDRDDFRKRASQAQYYSDFLSEKVRATKKARKLAGAYTGGGAAFGYRFTPDGLAIDPEQAALIHDAVKRLARHETVYRIVLDLNAAGQTTATGSRWRPKTLRRMLAGEHLTGGNGYPRILTDVEAAVVREELAEQPKLKARVPGQRSPLVRFLYCSECGQKLSTGSSGYYRCLVSHGGCGAVSIKATPLERYIALEGFRHYISERQSGRRRQQPKHQPVADTSPILEELRAVERRTNEVSAGIADGTLTVAVAGPAARQLEERRRALTEQLARSLPPIESGPTIRIGDIFTSDEVFDALGEVTDTFGGDYANDSFRERWEARQLTGAEAEQLRDLFADVLERATISPRAHRGHVFDPSRVSIQWRDGVMSSKGAA